MTPAQVGQNLVKSMDEQQYAHNLQNGGGDQQIVLDAQNGKLVHLSSSTERNKMARMPHGAGDPQAHHQAGHDAGASGEALKSAGSQLSMGEPKSPPDLVRTGNSGGVNMADAAEAAGGPGHRATQLAQPGR